MSSGAEAQAFLEGLTDTSLYSIGAYFSDEHPELVEEVIAQSEAIEELGLRRWAEQDGTGVEQAFQALMTGLAIRYFRAVSADMS